MELDLSPPSAAMDPQDDDNIEGDRWRLHLQDSGMSGGCGFDGKGCAGGAFMESTATSGSG